MKLIPPWAQIVIVVAAVALIFGAGWKVNGWRMSGKIQKLTAERDDAVRERDEKRAFAESCREDLAAEVQRLDEMREARDRLQDAYEEEISRPPERVVVYRDRWHEADEVIVSADCPQAVGQLVDYLHTLPGLAPEVPP